MPDINQLKEWKLEAELALHKLQTGGQAQEVTWGPSRRTVFTPAKIDELRRYISELENKINKAEGKKARGPIYPVNQNGRC